MLERAQLTLALGQTPQCRISVDNVVECRGLIRKTGGGKLDGRVFNVADSNTSPWLQHRLYLRGLHACRLPTRQAPVLPDRVP